MLICVRSAGNAFHIRRILGVTRRRTGLNHKGALVKVVKGEQAQNSLTIKRCSCHLAKAIGVNPRVQARLLAEHVVFYQQIQAGDLPFLVSAMELNRRPLQTASRNALKKLISMANQGLPRTCLPRWHKTIRCRFGEDLHSLCTRRTGWCLSAHSLIPNRSFQITRANGLSTISRNGLRSLLYISSCGTILVVATFAKRSLRLTVIKHSCSRHHGIAR